MPRRVTQADIDANSAWLLAEGVESMVLDDVIVDHSDRNGLGNVYYDKCVPVGTRANPTIWIKGGLGSDGKGYGAIHLGEAFPHTTSSTSIITANLTVGGSVTITVPTGLTLPVGHTVRLRSAANNSNNFCGKVNSYSGATLVIDQIFNILGASSTAAADWQLAVEFARSSAGNPVRIRPFAGRVELEYNATRSSGIEIWNCDYLDMDFETNTYNGLRDGWGSGRAGKFGLRCRSATYHHSHMGVKIDNVLGTAKVWKIRGIEISKGFFAALRVSLSVNVFDEIVFERCLFDRTFRGEGGYIGLTTSGPWPIHHALKFRDILLPFTGAEACQAQQCGNGSEIRNILAFGSDHDYRTAFQTDQDTAVQIDMVHGNVTFKDSIIDVFGKLGIHLFGKNAASQGVPFGTDRPLIQNVAIGGTKRQASMRMSQTMGTDPDPITGAPRGAQAAGIEIRDVDIYDPERRYEDVGPNNSHHMEMAGDTPVDQIGGTIYNDAYPIHIEEPGVRYYELTRGNPPAPQYIKSGFDGINVKRITRWYEAYYINTHLAFHQNATTSVTSIDPATLTIGGSLTFALRNTDNTFANGSLIKIYLEDGTKYVYGTVTGQVGANVTMTVTETLGSGATANWFVGKRIPYTAEVDFVWLMVTGATEASVPVALYKCKISHDAHRNNRPDLDTTKWEKVWWDINGKNMYQSGYAGNYTTDPATVAYDFRIVADTAHSSRGLSCNPQSELTTKYGWEWKQENGMILEIPGAYTDKLKIADYSYLRPGRYYRAWVEAMNSSGVFTAKTYSPWRLIA